MANEKNAEIIRKLMRILNRSKKFPVRIGTEARNLFCTDEGLSFRVSSAKGESFPTLAIAKKLGASEAELVEALKWVTKQWVGNFGESEQMFWAYVPKDRTIWPKVPRKRPRKASV